MCDDEINPWAAQDSTLSRRTFGMTAAAAVSVAATAQAEVGVTEKDVSVTTPDGVADAALFYPSGKGKWPAVLVWPDIGGLRPSTRAIGRRLAAQGYVVLVPNPFYRSEKSAVTSTFIWGEPEGRKKLMAYRVVMNTGQGPFIDAKAYIAFLDAQPQTDSKKLAGVQGYCMGGPLSFQTAGAVPARIGAVATFHGGGLVTAGADSPHLLVAKTKAAYLVAAARNDDAKAPGDKDVLKATFAETGRPATVEVYDADHGWCVRDNPVYSEAEAERAWAELTKLYKSALA